MSDEEEQFMAAMGELFAAERYLDILDAWGADASRSHDFKTEAFASYTPGSQDVVVSTYPKSGTTWVNQIAYQVGYLGAGDFEHIDDVVPWPDKLIPMENPEVDDVSHLADSPTGLHVIKSHLEVDYVPITAEARYICVVRDPKDMLVSMIHFENGFNSMLFGAEVPTAAFVESFTTATFMYQNWAEFTDSWWSLRDRENVLVLFYEEMRGDGDAAVRNIADFLGVELSAEQFAQVAGKSGFEWMKANAHRFDPPVWDQGRVSLVREGKTGAGKSELTSDQRRHIDMWCASEFERLGSDFAYRERYFA